MPASTSTTAPVLIPVIHVADEEQAFAELDLIQEAGLSHACLIDHYGRRWTWLKDLAELATVQCPGLQLAVNYLDLPAAEAVRRCPRGVRTIWSDDHLVRPDDPSQTQLAATADALAAARPEMLFCAAVAFKYQPYQPASHAELRQQTLLLARHFPALVTSGPGTGKATSLDKVATIAAALAELAEPPVLAVASGVAAANIGRLRAAGAGCFFVNSSVARGDRLQLDLLVELREALAES